MIDLERPAWTAPLTEADEFLVRAALGLYADDYEEMAARSTVDPANAAVFHEAAQRAKSLLQRIDEAVD